MRKLTILLLMLCMSFVLCSCGKNGAADRTDSHRNTAVDIEDYDDINEPDDAVNTDNEIEADIIFTNGEIVELELYPEVAPKTVANFVKNVQEGFYSGTIFHRVIEGFMVQGGGYDEEFNRKSVSETVEGEFDANGIDNNLKHTRGVISMARTNAPNSASTQFFIMHADAPHLDGQYAAFGRVVSGMEVIDEIAESPIRDNAPNGLADVPEELFVIQDRIIETED